MNNENHEQKKVASLATFTSEPIQTKLGSNSDQRLHSNETINRTNSVRSTSNEQFYRVPSSSNGADNDPKSNHRPRRPRRKPSGDFKGPKVEFEEKIVDWKRVSKTTKGGRQGRIWTLVVVGNKKGSVGFGIGKAEEFPDAMKKAVKNALKNVTKVKINANGTVYHENIGKHCASRVLIKPAKIGIGIIAGGAIKTVLELAGYTDIYSKNMGSNSPVNMVRATIKALEKQRTPAEVAALRDKKVSELY